MNRPLIFFPAGLERRRGFRFLPKGKRPGCRRALADNTWFEIARSMHSQRMEDFVLDQGQTGLSRGKSKLGAGHG